MGLAEQQPPPSPHPQLPSYNRKVEWWWWRGKPSSGRHMLCRRKWTMCWGGAKITQVLAPAAIFLVTKARHSNASDGRCVWMPVCVCVWGGEAWHLLHRS